MESFICEGFALPIRGCLQEHIPSDATGTVWLRRIFASKSSIGIAGTDGSIHDRHAPRGEHCTGLRLCRRPIRIQSAGFTALVQSQLYFARACG